MERKFLNCYGNEGEVEWMKENIGGGYAMVIDNERENAYSLILRHYQSCQQNHAT